MENETEEAGVYPVWINWEKRVVSFRQAEGFEKLEYPTHEEMFRFAVEKSLAGYAIQ